MEVIAMTCTTEEIQFLEISPHPVLVTSIQECFDVQNQTVNIFYSLKRKEIEQKTILTNACRLNLDDNTLPLYTFNHNDFYWYESEESVLQRRAKREEHHPLFGIRLWSLQQQSPTWKSIINLQLPQYAYLQDHQVQGQIYFPATGFIELALAAVNEYFHYSQESLPSTVIFNNVQFLLACILNENEPTEIHTVIQMPGYKQFLSIVAVIQHQMTL
ncbi:unnamed protein product [Rotaria sp. Silwood2]|nr:unnamed protein product [Rotaria sp. Silwood2]CAF4520579.1 unnamed protein product [Rotaria sp. Silwood2]